MSHYLIEQIAALAEHRRAHGRAGDRGRGRRRICARCASATPTGEREEPSTRCFVFIGAAPRTDWLEGVVARDERGFILAGADAKAAGWPLDATRTCWRPTVPGVFVAGDVRARSIKRVASAVGEGSMAVSLIHEYLAEMTSDSSRRPAPHRPLRRARPTSSSTLWAAATADPRRRRRGASSPSRASTRRARCCCSRARADVLQDDERAEPIGRHMRRPGSARSPRSPRARCRVRLQAGRPCRVAIIPRRRVHRCSRSRTRPCTAGHAA